MEGKVDKTDSELATMASQGGRDAFDQLWGRYDEVIASRVFQWCQNSDDAKDILQEVAIKSYKNIDKFDPKYNFGQWIYPIAYRTFIDYVRRQRQDISIEKTISSVTSIASSVPTPEETFFQIQQRQILERSLGKMSAEYRELIELRIYNEFSYEEIAQKLQIPIGTVKTRIHRARAKLCRLIIEGQEE